MGRELSALGLVHWPADNLAAHTSRDECRNSLRLLSPGARCDARRNWRAYRPSDRSQGLSDKLAPALADRGDPVLL